ncbi:MAG: sigma-70 family RNA polymerase sigma factor [Anaerolineae bacterium]|nr:sigma-70 family RNA polymerase sigma factor [Anaerolineae bacterium]
MASLGQPRSSEQWVAELLDREARTKALVDLREYLLRAVYVYLNRHRDDVSHLDRRELEQLAEDFVQDALLQILDKVDTFRGESKFTTWAYRFVINVAATELRLHRWRTLSLERLVSDDIPLFTFVGDERAPDPETVAVRNQILDLMGRIIREDLTERQRFALVSIHFQGVPVPVVARELETSPNNVYKLVHDARKKLKQGLERFHYSEADVLAIFGEP